MKLALPSKPRPELKSDSTGCQSSESFKGFQAAVFFLLPLVISVLESCTSLQSLIGFNRPSKLSSQLGPAFADLSFIQGFLLQSQWQRAAQGDSERFFALVNTPSKSNFQNQVLYLPADVQTLKASLKSQNNEAKARVIEAGRLSTDLILNDGQCLKLETVHAKETKARGLKEIKQQSETNDSQASAKNRVHTTRFETNTANERLLFLKIPHTQIARRSVDSVAEFFVARPNEKGIVTCEGVPETFVAGSSNGWTFEPAKKVQKNSAGQYLVELAPLAGVELSGSKNTSLKGSHLRLALKRDTQTWFSSEQKNELPSSWQSIQRVQDLTAGPEAEAYYQTSFIVESEVFRMKLPAGQYLFSLTDILTHEVCTSEFTAVEGRQQNFTCDNSNTVFHSSGEPTLSSQATQKQSEKTNEKFKIEQLDNIILTIPTLIDSHPLTTSLNRLFSRIESQNSSADGRARKQAQAPEGAQPPISFGSLSITAAFTASEAATQKNALALKGNSAVLTYADTTKRIFGKETALSDNSRLQSSEQVVLDNVIYDFANLSFEKNFGLESYLQSNQIPELAFLSNTSEAIDPLLMQTRLQFSSLSNLSTENMVTSVTNGVLFKWNSPNVTSSLVHLPSDGLVSLSVYIPSYNLTEYIEIYIGSKLYKRYVVDRKNYRDPLIFRIEEYFDASQDFQMTLHAWGKSFLPEYLYGEKGIRPRAIMSRLCFDVNKNSICDNAVSDQE